MGKPRLSGGAATFWLPALVLILLLAIGVLVGSFAIFYSEYTEEIERLRRDLLAAREKNGVYMAQENYDQITREIDLQRKEIVEKLEQIKAMEEETLKKEESCAQLQRIYEEQLQVLQATTEELDVTKSTLSSTRSKLKQTRRQRDEKGHIVMHQTHTEQQLAGQARDILKVADISTDHVRKLQSKLDRKRNVEKENELVNHQFRQGFAQSIKLMEDSLTRFAQDHSKFMTDLSSNYGSLMAKQSRDLSSLSELMSTLVKSQSQFAEGLGKTATENTHSTQDFIKSFLGTTRTEVSAQAATQHQFLVDQFLPKFQTITSTLHQQGQAVQHLQQTLTAELQQQADLVNVLLVEQKDGMNRLRVVAQQWDQQTDSQLRRINEQQTLSGQALSEFDAESNKQMQMIITLVNSVQQTRESFKNRLNETNTEVSDAVQKAQEERSDFYHVVETTANEFVNKGKEWRGQLEAARTSLQQASTASLEKSTGRIQEASKTCSVLEGDVASHVTGSQGAWQELYSAQETDLRKHSDHLNGGLMAHGHLTSQSLTALTAAAQTQEALLEEQRSDMTTVVRERKDDVEAHASAFKDWSLILGTEIKQRNEDVVKFLVEDLNEDVPTGQTPQRRDFAYPRFLASTSPHERIVQRYRQERSNQSESDDADDADSHKDDSAVADQLEFAELSGKRSTKTTLTASSLTVAVARSASMSDLSDGPSVAVNPLHRTASVEAVAAAVAKDNKENFSVPHVPPAGVAASKKRELRQPVVSARKILNAQNSKSFQ